MSEIGFTGKIPIPNLTKFGDISGAVEKQQALGLQRDALEQKKRAAQAKKTKDARAAQASLMAEMGGLYEDVHPYALSFVEEAYSELQQEVFQFMGLENGAELAKPFIENFKSSVDRYKINREMIASETTLIEMIDPQSSAALEGNKALGDFYKVSSDLDYVSAAQDFEYKGLMQNAKLDYKNGRFSVMGLAVDPSNGVGTEVTELSVHPYFNNETAFNPRTEMISPDTLEDFGKEIRGTEMASNRPWDEERISSLGTDGGYGSYYNQYLDFDTVNKEESAPFNWRRRSFFDNKEAIRERSVTASRLNDDELFRYFQLDPEKKKENGALYGMVQEAMNTSWRTTLNHTKYDQSKTRSTKDQIQSFTNGASNASIGVANLPVDPSGLNLYAGINVDEDENVNRALYDVINLESKAMENVQVPAYNDEFYKNLEFYMNQGLVDISETGNVIAGAKFARAAASGRDMSGIEAFIVEGKPKAKYKVQGIGVFENNPNMYSVVTDEGTEVSIDPDNLNWYTQPIHTAIMRSLDKQVGMSIADIYADADARFWNNPAGPPAGTSTTPTPPAGTSTTPTRVDAWGNPLPVE